MVNTFITNENFAVSAASLDDRRLNKQIVEGTQILNLIRHLNSLAYLYKTPFTPDKCAIPIKAYQIKSIIQRYNKEKLFGRPLYFQSVNLKIEYSLDQLPGYKEISLGFGYHPIIPMWLDYDSALCEYIYAHLAEWKKRGYHSQLVLPMNTNNTTHTIHDTHTISREVFWIPLVIPSHQASLIRKDSFYSNKFSELKRDIWLNKGYLWISHIPVSVLLKIELSSISIDTAITLAEYTDPPQQTA